MEEKILIVEDNFVEANALKLKLENAGYVTCGIARSVDQALEIIDAEKPTLVLVDIILKGSLTGIDLAGFLREKRIAFIYISANSNQKILEEAKATQPYGFLVKPFREKDLLVTLEIARYRHENSVEVSLLKEVQFEKELTSIVDMEGDWQHKLLETAKALQPYIPFDYVVAGFITEEDDSPYNALSFLRIGFKEYQVIGMNELQVITNLKLAEIKKLQQNTPIDEDIAVYSGEDFERVTAKPSMKKLFAETFKMNSNLVLPLARRNKPTFYFFFYSRRPNAYTIDHGSIARRLKYPLLSAMEGMLGHKSEAPSINTLSKAQTQLDAPIQQGFEGIVGKSHLLLNVFDYIAQVAPVDTSVLILGESGTGKERIADAIHNLSSRKDKPLVKINCAALPANLIESELFGHEKGAFTGAHDKRIGKFEMAQGGTLFLDEIGELPLDLQAKLLRVLQEREIERVGGRQPIKIDVRIIAATNRNLEKEVGEGRFRLDLYYRLNIFPIRMPALRERSEDIPLLVEHFIDLYNRKAGKKVKSVSDKAQRQFMEYHWPGNIRELENIIERSILLAKDEIIREVFLPEFSPSLSPTGLEEKYMPIKSIEENERDHITAVLKKCNGRIWGSGGAAELLGVPPTTLTSKMKKLGISKDFLN